MQFLLHLTLLVLVSEGLSEGPDPGVDIVLECWYVEEGSVGLRGLAGGFSREEALLILRKVPVPEEDDTSAWTEYSVREADRNRLVFEATVSEVPIPYASLLLHADCEGQEVSCEISGLESRGVEGGDLGPSFGASVRIAGSSLGLAIVLRAQDVPPEERVRRDINKKLDVVLSTSGTIDVNVDFLVYTRATGLQASLGQSIDLDCGFLGADSREVSVEWRRQHKGSGRMVYSVSQGQAAAEREGASMELAELAGHGNASLHLRDLTLKDEGVYICIVQSARNTAQQTITVDIVMPPRVTLRPPALYFQEGMSETLSCEASHYYPLDVSVEWSVRGPGGGNDDDDATEAEPRPLPGVSFRSHRRNRDGTFNLTSEVSIKPGSPERGSLYTCQVSHSSLPQPLTVSLLLREPPAEDWMNISLAPGILIASILFALALGKFYLWKARDPPEQGAGNLPRAN